jgi:hypothetical protein
MPKLAGQTFILQKTQLQQSIQCSIIAVREGSALWEQTKKVDSSFEDKEHGA